MSKSDSLLLTITTNLPDPWLSQAKAQTSHNESLRLSRQLESLNRRHEEVERENSKVKAENRNLAKSMENLKIQARRVNELESENLELEGWTNKESLPKGWMFKDKIDNKGKSRPSYLNNHYGSASSVGEMIAIMKRSPSLYSEEDITQFKQRA